MPLIRREKKDQGYFIYPNVVEAMTVSHSDSFKFEEKDYRPSYTINYAVDMPYVAPQLCHYMSYCLDGADAKPHETRHMEWYHPDELRAIARAHYDAIKKK